MNDKRNCSEKATTDIGTCKRAWQMLTLRSNCLNRVWFRSTMANKKFNTNQKIDRQYARMAVTNNNGGGAKNRNFWFSNQIECELLRFRTLGKVSNRNHQRINLFNIHYSFYSSIEFIMHRIDCHKNHISYYDLYFFPITLYFIVGCEPLPHIFGWKAKPPTTNLYATQMARPLSLSRSLSLYVQTKHTASSSLCVNKDAGQSA